jgi:hypothetical protein
MLSACVGDGVHTLFGGEAASALTHWMPHDGSWTATFWSDATWRPLMSVQLTDILMRQPLGPCTPAFAKTAAIGVTSLCCDWGVSCSIVVPMAANDAGPSRLVE